MAKTYLVTILGMIWGNLIFAQSTTTITYDVSGNRISKKMQGSSRQPSVTASPQAVNVNQQAILTASGCPGFIRWNTGQEMNRITVTPAQSTQYIAECLTVGCPNNGSAKVKVDVIQCVADEVTAAANVASVRYGQAVTLSAFGCTGTVQWSTGQAGNNAIVKIYGPSSTITATCQKPYCPNSGSANVVVAGLVASSCVAGDVLVTIKAGNWNDGTIWQCGRVPTINDEVYLGHVVNLPVNGTARSLILGSGYVIYQNNSYLTLSAN